MCQGKLQRRSHFNQSLEHPSHGTLRTPAVQRHGKGTHDLPLHLGVTEAGEGEDGRIKSAVGIGALLADGIGDTLRVSSSEEPQVEVPVAYKLAEYVVRRAGHYGIPARRALPFCYERPQRRPTCAVGNIGGNNVPVVISAHLQNPTEAPQNEQLKPDYYYVGTNLPEAAQRVKGMSYIVDASAWRDEPDVYPRVHQASAHARALVPCQGKIPFPLLPRPQ